MTQIRLKRGTTVPLAGDLVTGELAIDTSNGTVYTKKDDGNVVAISGGGGASTIPLYDNGVTYTVGQQVIFDNRFWYMSTSVGGAGYDPVGYPSYWTEISSSGSGGSYLPLAGGTMTGAIVFDSVGGQNINKGTFDSGMGGYNGISLYCAVGYELNWQAGWLTSSYYLGSTGFTPIKIDSGAGSPLQVFDKSTGNGVQISHTGITFPDSTVQTTAIATGPAGTNGIDGGMNYLDMLTVTASSAGLYVSGGTWSASYGFINTSGGWLYNKLSVSGVDFKFYINGTYDSTANGAYNYYYASASHVATPVTGDIMTVFLSDGTNEATIPFVTATY